MVVAFLFFVITGESFSEYEKKISHYSINCKPAVGMVCKINNLESFQPTKKGRARWKNSKIMKTSTRC